MPSFYLVSCFNRILEMFSNLIHNMTITTVWLLPHLTPGWDVDEVVILSPSPREFQLRARAQVSHYPRTDTRELINWSVSSIPGWQMPACRTRAAVDRNKPWPSSKYDRTWYIQILVFSLLTWPGLGTSFNSGLPSGPLTFTQTLKDSLSPGTSLGFWLWTRACQLVSETILSPWLCISRSGPGLAVLIYYLIS